MLDYKIQLIEDLYTIYSESMLSGQIAWQDLDVIKRVQWLADNNKEHQAMIRRIFYGIQMKRIQVFGMQMPEVSYEPSYQVA